MNYYTAEGLREVTTNSVLDGKNKNLNTVFTITGNQARLGYFNAYIPFELTDGEVRFLEGIGYKLKKKTIMNIGMGFADAEKEVNYYIEW